MNALPSWYAPNCCSRIVLLPKGAGPRQVVGLQLSETLRSHTDLQTDQPNAKYTREALKSPLQSRAGACFVVDSASRSFRR